MIASSFIMEGSAPPLHSYNVILRQSDEDCRRISTANRSEEHTSELQSPDHLVCRLLLEKKKGVANILPEHKYLLGLVLAHGLGSRLLFTREDYICWCGLPAIRDVYGRSEDVLIAGPIWS